MVQSRIPTYVLAAALLLPGCSSGNVWPDAGPDGVREVSEATDGGAEGVAELQEAPTDGTYQVADSGMTMSDATAGGPPPQPPQPPVPPAGPAPLALGTGNFDPVQLAQAAQATQAAAPTGTFVGQKVVELRAELDELKARLGQHNSQLQQLRATSMENAQRFHQAVALINTRLQVGTTPGNPELVAQWNQAQVDLNRIGDDITAMNQLSTAVAGDSARAAFILESVRAAFGLSGALEEDHRQLSVLEDDVNRTVVLIDRLLNELSGDIERQTLYLSSEQRNMVTMNLAIKNGELYGTSLANRAFISTSPRAPTGMAAAAPPGSAAASGQSPLVIIRFDTPNVDYEQALYNAVSQALELRPNAAFDLLAVAPATGTAAEVAVQTNQAKRNAEQVLRSLSNMGLPASRVALSSTTRDGVDTNEVHLFVR